MWVMLNDAMFSIVEDRNDSTQLVVRARREGDIEKVFKVPQEDVFENDTSDYRFRIWVDRDRVEEVISDEVRRIDYTNFKDSVGDDELHDAYVKVWTAMFNMQEKKYTRSIKCWEKYFEEKYGIDSTSLVSKI